MAARKIKLAHPGKILREEFMEPVGLSAYALANDGHGAGGPRIHIGFMRIRDLYARCAFSGDGDFDATRK